MDTSVVPSLSDCHFYHAMDLPGISPVNGDWDLRGRFEQYIGNISLKGRTVLDVGTASGFLSFEAEKRGATVFSFDADGPERMQLVPPDTMNDASDNAAYRRRFFRNMQNSYLYAHHAFKSKATPIYGDIYRMSEVVPRCDVVIVAQILVHLRDPFGALQQAALAAKEQLVVIEGMPDLPESALPVAYFLGDKVSYSWWHLSRQFYDVFLPRLGFRLEDVTSAEYMSHGKDMHRITTIVARRR
jgi:hypothetical protein